MPTKSRKSNHNSTKSCCCSIVVNDDRMAPLLLSALDVITTMTTTTTTTTNRNVNNADSSAVTTTIVESYLWFGLGLVLIAAHPTELAAWSAVGLFVQKSFFQQQQQQQQQPEQQQQPSSTLQDNQHHQTSASTAVEGNAGDNDNKKDKSSSIMSSAASSSSLSPRQQVLHQKHHYYYHYNNQKTKEKRRRSSSSSKNSSASSSSPSLFRRPGRPPQGIAILILTCLFTITRQQAQLQPQYNHNQSSSPYYASSSSYYYYNTWYAPPQDYNLSWWRPRTFAWMVPWALSISQTGASSSSSNNHSQQQQRQQQRRKPASSTLAWIRLGLALLGVWCHAAWQWYAVGKMLVGHWSCALLEQATALHGVFTIDEWQIVSFIAGSVWLEWMDMLVRARTHDSSRYDSHHAVVACAGNMGVWLATSLLASSSSSSSNGSSSNGQSQLHQSTSLQQRRQQLLQQQQQDDKMASSLATQLAIVISLPAALIEISLALVQAPAPWTGLKTVDWLIDFMSQVERPLWNSPPLPVPRVVWVAYWGVVAFGGIRYAPMGKSSRSSSSSSSSTTTTTTTTTSTSNGNSHGNGNGSVDVYPRISTTVARKWFHAVACVLFTPVTLYAPILQSTGYAVACALLVMAEGLRRHVPVWNAFVASYVDRRKEDAGAVVVSHLALIAGCALPLWCYEFGSAALLSPVTAFWGICTLGVGDACAALVGTYANRIGKAHNWSRSNRRTMEGSVAMGAGQLIFLVILNVWIPIPWSASVAAVVFVTLLEAWTTHMDNIMLPMATTAFFCLWQQACP